MCDCFSHGYSSSLICDTFIRTQVSPDSNTADNIVGQLISVINTLDPIRPTAVCAIVLIVLIVLIATFLNHLFIFLLLF
ncbi:hypothetical phage protein [Streptococcus pyogenes MGAS8232]|nr:hypothetical phage protein [Streptococcus pyogenes MGAS8232]